MRTGFLEQGLFFQNRRAQDETRRSRVEDLLLVSLWVLARRVRSIPYASLARIVLKASWAAAVLSLLFHRNVASPPPNATAPLPNATAPLPNATAPSTSPDDCAPEMDALLADLFNEPTTTTTAAAAAVDPFAPSTSNHVFVPGQPPVAPSALQAALAAQQALENMPSTSAAPVAAGGPGAQAPLLVRCVKRCPYVARSCLRRAQFTLQHPTSLSQSHHPDPHGSTPLSSEPAPRLQHTVSLQRIFLHIPCGNYTVSYPTYALALAVLSSAASTPSTRPSVCCAPTREFFAPRDRVCACVRAFAASRSSIAAYPRFLAATKPGMSTTTSHMSRPLSSSTSPPLSLSSESSLGNREAPFGSSRVLIYLSLPSPAHSQVV